MPQGSHSGQTTGLTIDDQVLAEMAPLLAAAAQAPTPALGDIASRRANFKLLFDTLAAARSPIAGVGTEHYDVIADDGAKINVIWYYPAGRVGRRDSAVLYLHGGGMFLSLNETGRIYHSLISHYVASSGVPMLLVDYRTAPEHADLRPVLDGYSALSWLVSNANALAVDPRRIAVMGDSAGGGLAAGVCLIARDQEGPAVAQQILVYPMLDDTTTSGRQPTPFLTWTYEDNLTAWQALLGARSADRPDVSAYAAPARAADLSGLPAAYIDVGGLDIFCEEDLAYARLLINSGVSTELHLYPGCPHAFDLLAPNADISVGALTNRIRRLGDR